MEKRLAFVFSGGGAKGAFGVGVLVELARLFPRLAWHIVSGTSTGSLITPLAALAAGDREELDVLTDFYLKARRRRIVDSNFEAGDVLRIAKDFPDGIFNLDPLKKKIKRALDGDRLARLAASDVVAVVNAVSLQTGALVLCTQDRHRERLEGWFAGRAEEEKPSVPVEFLPFDRFRKAMRASSSIPGAIEPVVHKLGGKRQQLVDGGVIDIAPLRAALAAGATHMVVVLMSPTRSTPVPDHQGNPLAVALRAIELLTDEIMRGDVQTVAEVSGLSRLARELHGRKAIRPAAVRKWLAEPDHRTLIERLARRVEVEVRVIQPDVGLGESLDFDSIVPAGWPGEETAGEARNIMRARYDHGVAVARRDVGLHRELSDLLAGFCG